MPRTGQSARRTQGAEDRPGAKDKPGAKRSQRSFDKEPERSNNDYTIKPRPQVSIGFPSQSTESPRGLAWALCFLTSFLCIVVHKTVLAGEDSYGRDRLAGVVKGVNSNWWGWSQDWGHYTEFKYCPIKAKRIRPSDTAKAEAYQDIP